MSALPMTADLVARLESAADECAKDAPLLREAASALRSSGEAVEELRSLRYVRDYIATSGQDYGIGSYRPNGSGFERNFSNRDDLLCCIDRQIEKLTATPASAWRPIAELDHRDSRVVLFCDARGNRWTQTADCRVPVCGLPPTLWQELPTPPTSTKGG